jgi:excisionase family DNA binding protein
VQPKLGNTDFEAPENHMAASDGAIRLQEPLLDVRTAAELLRLKPKTIYQLVAQRELPCLRVGPRTIRFDRETLAEYLSGASR